MWFSTAVEFFSYAVMFITLPPDFREAETLPRLIILLPSSPTNSAAPGLRVDRTKISDLTFLEFCFQTEDLTLNAVS